MNIIDESAHYAFEFEQGNWYMAYKRTYNDGMFDVEVYPKDREDLDVAGEVQDAAEKYLDELGLL